MDITDQYGLYDERWDESLIHPSCMRHPGKFSKLLITWIVRRGLSDRFWNKGDTIIDPFAGVGLGGVISAYHGLRWIGCELEFEFTQSAMLNFVVNARRWKAAGDPMPSMAWGDSRQLSKFVAPVTDGVITSPPFLNSTAPSAGINSERRAEVAAALGKRIEDVTPTDLGAACEQDSYGNSAGQIGRMTGNRYWKSCEQVYEQIHGVMRDSSVACLVVKDVILNGGVFQLTEMTCDLLNKVGFDVFEITRCWLTKTKTYHPLFGDEPTEVKKKRASYYKRLYEREHPENAIDFECVIWARKRELNAASTGRMDSGS